MLWISPFHTFYELIWIDWIRLNDFKYICKTYSIEVVDFKANRLLIPGFVTPSRRCSPFFPRRKARESTKWSSASGNNSGDGRHRPTSMLLMSFWRFFSFMFWWTFFSRFKSLIEIFQYLSMFKRLKKTNWKILEPWLCCSVFLCQ